jgi:Rieske Fe-S protein
LNPHAVQTLTNHVTIPARSIPRPGQPPYYDRDYRFFLVNLRPGEGVPGSVLGQAALFPLGSPSRGGGLLALYARCPFHGCTSIWRPDLEFAGVTGWFRCLGCGSMCTKAGLHVFGPALRALDTLVVVHVSVSGVAIDTISLRTGGTDDAQRTVPAAPFPRGRDLPCCHTATVFSVAARSAGDSRTPAGWLQGRSRISSSVATASPFAVRYWPRVRGKGQAPMRATAHCEDDRGRH